MSQLNHPYEMEQIENLNKVDQAKYLSQNQIGFLIHYPIPPHQQEALADFSKYSFPVTEKIHQQVVSIPISPVLNNDHIKKIIEVLNSY